MSIKSILVVIQQRKRFQVQQIILSALFVLLLCFPLGESFAQKGDPMTKQRIEVEEVAYETSKNVRNLFGIEDMS